MTSPPPFDLWFVLLTGLLIISIAAFYRLANSERNAHYTVVIFVGGLIFIGVFLYWWMCLPVCAGF